MKKLNIIIFLLLLTISSCTTGESGFKSASIESKEQIEINQLNLERIKLDSINTSSFGESLILPDNTIAFIDKHFCRVSVFDTIGKFHQSYLGLGGAPNETQIGRIAAHTLLSDGRLVLFGYNLDFHVFKNYANDKMFILKRRCTDNSIDGNSETYTNQYGDMVCRSYKNKIYFNIFSEHPKFNFLDHTDEYLKKCRHIWEIDIDKQKDTRLLAKGYPESYSKDPKKHVIFMGTCYDIDRNGNFYVCYDTDPYIYVYNNDFIPEKAFGIEGKEMNTDYLYIDNYKECRKNFRSERNNKGYYYWIEYVDETKLLFRSYKKDSKSEDGLQIYKDNVLFAEVNVPKGFRVMGYIAPYYYSYIIPLLDENDDSLIMYRFKLDEL